LPAKLASAIRRSMTATRTLTRALKSGVAIAEGYKKVRNEVGKKV
jgi:hypothetical protein